MKIAMINGSPKSKDSTSGYLLAELKGCVAGNAVIREFCMNKPQIDDETRLELNSCDALVFAYPLYVDGIPSQLLSCLCQIEKMGMENRDIMVFGIVNSGFYEGRQNAVAIEILENWCHKVKLQWGMGVGVGGGGGLSKMKSVPLGKGPKVSLAAALHTLRDHIENRTAAENLYVSVDFPRWLYKLAAETGWKQQIKKNGGKPKDLDRRL